MTDQMFKDLLSLVLIVTVMGITCQGHTVDPQVKEWADVAFGFLFGIKTQGYTIGKPNSSVSKTTIETQTQVTSPEAAAPLPVPAEEVKP